MRLLPWKSESERLGAAQERIVHLREPTLDLLAALIARGEVSDPGELNRLLDRDERGWVDALGGLDAMIDSGLVLRSYARHLDGTSDSSWSAAPGAAEILAAERERRRGLDPLAPRPALDEVEVEPGIRSRASGLADPGL